MTSPFQPTHLPPSKLGTKEYWESTYTTDLTTHSNHPTHTGGGSSWFADVRASQKLLTLLLSPALSLSKQLTTFLDLGTGNGEMLFTLREKGGFRGRMIGVDYAGASVELCRRVAGGKGLGMGEGEGGGLDISVGREEGEGGGEEGKKGIQFHKWDILTSPPPHPSWTSRGFDVVLDKGTFDAIGMCGERDARGRRVVEGYRDVVRGLVRKGGGVFVVTSCNWTEGELRGWFEGGEEGGEEGGGLEWWGRVEYPVFRFGGGEGQSVQSVVFRRL